MNTVIQVPSDIRASGMWRTGIRPGMAAVVAATLMAAAVPSFAAPPEDEIRVYVKFEPSTVSAGQSTTLSWRTAGPAVTGCTVSGVPGLSYGDDVGSFTFTPTATLQAIVACTGPMAPDPGSGSAQVTVYPAGTPPIVTADFYPSRIYKGQSSTLRWSSKLATSCSSTGAVSISGTSGSRTITATSDQTVTITCVGSGGQSSRAATLTAVDRPPIVHASFSPWSLDGPGWATFSWSSSYATHCNRGGTWGSQWSYYTSNTSEWVTCYGPGGTASAWDMLIVNSTAQANPEEKKAANPQLAALGFDVASPSILSSTHDFNDDGNIDALVVDAARGEGYVVLGGPLSQSRIAKVIPDISTLDQVNNITVVGKAGDAIMVDVNR